MTINDVGDRFKDLPLGFSFSLAMNEKALDNFAKMSDTEKQQVVEEARSAQSKGEMQQIVNRPGEE